MARRAAAIVSVCNVVCLFVVAVRLLLCFICRRGSVCYACVPLRATVGGVPHPQRFFDSLPQGAQKRLTRMDQIA